MPRRILLVEDDRAIATVITRALEEEGLLVDRVDSIAGRDRALEENKYAAMLTDVMLADGDGLSTLSSVRERNPGLPVIVLSAQNTLDTAVRATEIQAFEYFPKPFDLEELVRVTVKAASREGDRPATGLEETSEALPLVGRSQAMQGVYRMITRVLHNDLTVLILGESGTGKELVAEAIHQLGSRRSGPFVAVNAAAIPRDLLESELFGHEKGAFTGATSQVIGKFEQANGGTLFLDEIGDMPAEAQTRLLRALQSGRIRRVGGRQEIGVDVRILAATNRDLAPMIAAGTFREDLYYRLAVVPIELPPLRERRDDIAPLVRHFLAQAISDGLPRRQIDAAALTALEAWSWPGNVRELRNAVYRLALLARQDIIDAEAVETILGQRTRATVEEAPAGFAKALTAWLRDSRPTEGEIYDSAIAQLERPLFEYALSRTRGNQLRAARLLGINRNTLRKRLTDLGIDPDAGARDNPGGLQYDE
ncbi:nitrogen regulation protein NR(I) [Tsuneonella deserti]|uniref:DNA-binding transcriptional regulator NtrC n=1 Tax=Tsuneonella deserti TaxID=2035528 RepID=A0ABQ1S684_9SPHN|nr:nitrogen regulation protein NR(I) [Tsuneonella deserti]GGD92593.1 nitrogen regulation protein NR(I) [Tsuneonella deserti]